MARWYLAVGLVLAVSGCFTSDSARPSNLVRRWQPFMGDDAVQIDVALIVRPVGDPYLNKDLWTQTDEMVVDLERRPALEENGLRVGQVVGVTPAQLQELLKSERWCNNQRRRLLPCGQVATQYLSNQLGETSFEVVLKGQTQEIVLNQARFCLDVTPIPGKKDATRLQFLPKVEHGENYLPFKPDPKQSAWVLTVEKPAKAFPNFGWDLQLPPGNLLVIGACLDKPESFGHRALVQEEGPDRGQRLLVIRTIRSSNARESNLPTLEDQARKGTSIPLALEATRISARASGH